jgi:DNA mismatch repair protein MSH5
LETVNPRLTRDRHILQEKVVSNFIPNDTLLAGGEGESATGQPEMSSLAPQYRTEDGSVVPSMILVTGPNFSGKSVYLKQVAIIVFIEGESRNCEPTKMKNDVD